MHDIHATMFSLHAFKVLFDDLCAHQLFISVAYTMDMLGNWISNDWKEKAPELVALMERIYVLPKIKKWIETRPHSEH